MVRKVALLLIVLADFRLFGGEEGDVRSAGHVVQEFEYEEVGELVGGVKDGQDQAEEGNRNEDGFREGFGRKIVHVIQSN